MKMTTPYRAALGLLLAVWLAPALAAASPSAAGRKILETTGITLEQIRSLGDEPLVVELEVSDSSQQAAFAGLIQLDRDPSELFAAETGRAVPALTAPRRFGDFAPHTEAVGIDGLQLAAEDYDVLQECRPADCRFKLDAHAIRTVQQIDWKAGNARDRFLEWFGRQLRADVLRYRSEGLDGLITYADKPRPFPVAQGVVTLQQETAPLLELYPEIHDYLSGYPEVPREGVSDRLVWTLSDFGFRPTLSVDHVVVTHSGEAEGLRRAIVLRTIYASHYMAGRLQLASVIDGEKVFGVPGHYVLALDQILFDDRVGGIKRVLIGRGIRSKVSDRLVTLRERAATPSGAPADDV